jgi:hypothetical protein
VLDATQLLADLGQMEAADAAERASSAELARLHQLFSGGRQRLATSHRGRANRAGEVADRGAVCDRASRFALGSGCFACPDGARQIARGVRERTRSLLVRAELPGLHSLGALPAKAMLDVDGVQVPGRILGVLTPSLGHAGRRAYWSKCRMRLSVWVRALAYRWI